MRAASGAPAPGRTPSHPFGRPRVRLRVTLLPPEDAAQGSEPVAVPVAAAVAPLAPCGPTPAAASLDPDALVRAITDELDLESAYLYLLGDETGVPCLRLAAHTGEHSAFMTEAPSITLDADLPVVRALLGRMACFDSDPHGLGDDASEESGVGRWRAAIGAQAEATLPLLADGEAIGALALSWRTPRAFDAADRRSLEAMANATARAIGPLRAGPSGSDNTRARVLESASFSVDAAGRVGSGARAGSSVMRIDASTAGTHPGAAAPFTAVTACSGTRTAVALGVVRSDEMTARDRATEATRLLEGWMGHGLESAAALDALTAWAAGVGAKVAAVTAVLDPDHHCVTYATSGPALVAALATDARFLADVAPGTTGTQAGAVEKAAVLLPGDRLALWSGSAGGPAPEAASAREALAGAGGAGSHADGLLGALSSPDRLTAAAIVIEVART